MTNSLLNDSVNTRIAVLEVIVIDLKKDRDHHSGILDTMAENNHKMAMALERISTQIATVTRSIGVAFVLVTTLVSGGWIYQQRMDEKIAGNTQAMTTQLAENAKDLVTQDKRLNVGVQEQITQGERLDADDLNDITRWEKSADNSDRLDKLENNKVDKAKRYLK